MKASANTCLRVGREWTLGDLQDMVCNVGIMRFAAKRFERVNNITNSNWHRKLLSYFSSYDDYNLLNSRILMMIIFSKTPTG